MKKWLKLLQSNKGFSLIEAIVTVVIVGIAMVPISMVFTQTINTTVDTRQQLQANGLAQEYIEAIKSKEFSEFDSLFSGGTSRVLTSATDFAALGLEVLPKNFKATISYATDVDLAAYALPAGKTPVDVDTIINIEGGYDPIVDVRNGDSSGSINYPTAAIASTNRTILIRARRDTNFLEVLYYDGGILKGSGYSTSLSEDAVRIVMGNSGSTVTYVNQLSTIIQVDSNLPRELNVYIYETGANTVNATTEILSGFISFSRNLTEVTDAERRIVEIQVEIRDTVTDEVLAVLTTTKIDE